MANTKFEYVKQFEQPQILLPNAYIVVRIDGKGFHKFTKFYDFAKPNDEAALKLMSLSASVVMETFPDVQMAYGQSDEYSFVLKKDSDLFNRRSDKIATCICSTFSSTINFEKFMNKKLQLPYLPIFDARCVIYPDLQNIRDYFSWRQADCHINNLYNTCFWGLVLSGIDKQQAEKILCGTNAGEKNEILFQKVGKNYNNEPEMFKKGTTLIRQPTIEGKQEFRIEINLQNEQQKLNKKQRNKLKQQNNKVQQPLQEQQQDLSVQEFHVDIIKDEFWQKNKEFILL